jgi:GTP-binding protein
VSGAPGKTRTLNVFEVRAWRGVGAQHAAPLPDAPCYLLDLPGYGWARASKAERAAFAGLVRDALARPRLAGAVWLLDIRREPSPDDRAMQDALARHDTRVLAAFTKGDKLPRGRRLMRERALREALGLDADQTIVTSAKTGDGIADLREAIGKLLGG